MKKILKLLVMGILILCLTTNALAEMQIQTVSTDSTNTLTRPASNPGADMLLSVYNPFGGSPFTRSSFRSPFQPNGGVQAFEALNTWNYTGD